MAEQKHPDAGISEHREFIDELEQLSSPDPGGFYNAPESVTDIDEIDDVGAILQDSSSNDDYLPVEPEPLVETWVGGRRVDPGRNMFRLLAIIASLAIFVFIILLLAGLLDSTQSGPQGTPLQRELAEGRQVIIEAGPLGAIAPFLHPDRLIRGNDIDLVDHGVRVSPGQYRFEFEWQTPQILILLDFSRPLTDAQKSRLRDLLGVVSSAILKKQENEPETLCSVWTWDQGRPLLHTAARPVSQTDLQGLANLSGTWAPKNSMLLSALASATGNPDANSIILHFSDYSPAASKDFSSERFYTLLKQQPRTAIAGLRLGDERPGEKREDPLRYVSDNAADFVLPNWAFICENVITNTPAALGVLLSRRAPVQTLRIIYKPDESILDEATTLRSLSISLRVRPRDLKLTTLNARLYSPRAYRPVLDGTTPELQRVIPASNGMAARVEREWIFGVSPGSRKIQYSAGRLAARMDSVILAALPGGFFLARSMQTNMNQDTDPPDIGLHPDITFLSPHLAFPEEIQPVQSIKSNLASVFFSPRTGAPVEIASPLLIAATRLENVSHPAIRTMQLARLGNPALYTNTSGNDTAHALLDAVSLPCNAGYRRVGLFSASPLATGAGTAGRVFVSGFEMLAVIDSLGRDTSASNGTLLLSSQALTASAWGPGVTESLNTLIRGLAARGITLITPGDDPETSQPDFSINNLVRVFPVDTIDQIRSPRRAEQFARVPAGYALAPASLPGSRLSGPALSAAWAAGMACRIRSLSPDAGTGVIAEVLLRSSELRGEILASRSFLNHGLLSPRILPAVISNRNELASMMLRFSRMAHNPYKDAESLFCDGFLKTLAPGTMIIPLPEALAGKRFTRAYQYFDRKALYHGVPATAPRYDANEPFAPSQDERDELALVAWRGSLFLFCTRNGNRGWIINYESLPSHGQSFGFDQDDGLFFLATRHGEIMVLDPASGLILPVAIQTASGIFRYPAIPTDHGNGQLSIAVDARQNTLWITGSGSRYLTRLTWTRSGGLVHIRYQEEIDAHGLVLADAPFSPLAPLDNYLSPAILHGNGTFNVLTSGKKPRYLRLNARGALIPGQQ